MKATHHSWFYGPKGEAKTFEKGDDVPAGWHDHPAKHAKQTGDKVAEEKLKLDVGTAGGATDKGTGTTKETGAGGNVSIAPGDFDKIDADGHPWSAELHATTKTFTSAGKWRMAPGKSRPAPLPGFPKPVGIEKVVQAENPDHPETPNLDL